MPAFRFPASALPRLPRRLRLRLLALGVMTHAALAVAPTASGAEPPARTQAQAAPAKSPRAATAGKPVAAPAGASKQQARNRPATAATAPKKRPAQGQAVAGAALSVNPATAAAAGVWPAGFRPQANDPVVEAREALRKRDRARLAALRDSARRGGHPLAMWADYFELSNRLGEAAPAEVEAFLARWPGTYVEDRARNDWLLELGRRRDWGRFGQELPRFRMNDDREVACYALLLRHQAGEDVTAAARAAWLAQRDLDDGCTLLATTLTEARRLGPADAWAKARAAIEVGRPRIARQAVGLVQPAAAPLVAELFDNPQRFLTRHADQTRGLEPRVAAELWALAVMRLAASDPQAAASELSGAPPVTLGADGESWLWHAVAKQAAMKLQPQADDWFARAGANPRARPELTDDTLAWKVRAALRGQPSAARWQRVLQSVDAMSAETRRADPAWTYWKGRAQLALAAPGEAGESARLHGRATLSTIANHLSFYGKLAAEELGQVQPLPPHPAPLSAAERENATRHPGLGRALALMSLGLRQEGVREWNWSLIGMDDRALLAAAQRACDAQVWDRCINTSERTRELVDLRQRFPMPFQEDVQAAARRAGVEPAYVYGLIRQESRFLTDARSGVGASGLMQVMPATAKWTAKKLGVPFQPKDITDPEINLRLGTGYLKLVLDDFEGSQAMAAAAYNAGPGRPRRWRDGPAMEVAAWAENIPFNETRDYVKKVLSNTAYYAALMGDRTMAPIKTRLQGAIGPRAGEAAAENRELP